jgi:hypothetical protein
MGSGLSLQAPGSIRGYILDFAEHSARLVVEVDGSQHSEPTHLATEEIRGSRSPSTTVPLKKGHSGVRVMPAVLDGFRYLTGIGLHPLEPVVEDAEFARAFSASYACSGISRCRSHPGAVPPRGLCIALTTSWSFAADFSGDGKAGV